MTWRDIPGWFDFEALYERVAQAAIDESALVEVGVWRGRSLAFLATRLKELGKRPKLVAVDTWAGSPGESSMQEQLEQLGGADGLWADFWWNMRACGCQDDFVAMRMESAEAAGLFSNGQVDFVFIDAAHTYEAVRDDLAAWVPKMKPGGTIAGHDFNHPGVERAVREVFGDEVELEGICWLKRLPGDDDLALGVPGGLRPEGIIDA